MRADATYSVFVAMRGPDDSTDTSFVGQHIRTGTSDRLALSAAENLYLPAVPWSAFSHKAVALGWCLRQLPPSRGRMARGRVLSEQGQKTTAVEIVDLTSEDDSDPPNLSPLHNGADEDAPIVGSEDDDQTGEEQWESRSLFEDALEELEDERLIDMGEQIKHSQESPCVSAHSTVGFSSRRVLHPRGSLGLPEESSARW